MIENVPLESVEHGLDRTVAVLRSASGDLTRRLGVKFHDIHEDGLGGGVVAVVRTDDGFQFLLRQFHHGRPNHIELVINERSVAPREDLARALAALAAATTDVDWIAPELQVAARGKPSPFRSPDLLERPHWPNEGMNQGKAGA